LKIIDPVDNVLDFLRALTGWSSLGIIIADMVAVHDYLALSRLEVKQPFSA